ncbi:hypothetical protein EBZ39_03455 [bacterium]|nr:hypothetical protein [bacterium]
MATLEARQKKLLGEFDSDVCHVLEGVVAKMDVPGVGHTFNYFRRPRELTRPPAVTLEPTRNGLFLSMTISRPKGGQLIYGKVLGRWDFTAPLRVNGPLDAANSGHRVVAGWGCTMAEALLTYARSVKSGNNLELPPARFPRLLVPFVSGYERIDEAKRAITPEAIIDTDSMPGLTLVDARIAVSSFVARAINDNMAWEDYRPVLGQFVPNPFNKLRRISVEVENPARRLLAEKNITQVDKIPQDVLETLAAAFRRELSGGEIAEEQVYDALLNSTAAVQVEFPVSVAAARRKREFIVAARRQIGGLAAAASDADILSAAKNPEQDMKVSGRSIVQVVTVESLQDLPEPYSGNILPTVNWSTPVPAIG